MKTRGEHRKSQENSGFGGGILTFRIFNTQPITTCCLGERKNLENLTNFSIFRCICAVFPVLFMRVAFCTAQRTLVRSTTATSVINGQIKMLGLQWVQESSEMSRTSDV